MDEKKAGALVREPRPQTTPPGGMVCRYRKGRHPGWVGFRQIAIPRPFPGTYFKRSIFFVSMNPVSCIR